MQNEPGNTANTVRNLSEKISGGKLLFSVSTVSHWPTPIDTGAGCRDRRTLNKCHFSETEVFYSDIHYKESFNSKVVPISCGSTGGYNSRHNFAIGLTPPLVSQL